MKVFGLEIVLLPSSGKKLKLIFAIFCLVFLHPAPNTVSILLYKAHN